MLRFSAAGLRSLGFIAQRAITPRVAPWRSQLVRSYADAAPAQAAEPTPRTGGVAASAKVTSLADQIASLTVLEASQLASVLKVQGFDAFFV